MRQKNSSPFSLQEHPQRTFLLVSIGLVLILYWRSFTSPFVYDDLDQVVNNPNLGSWSTFAQRFLLHPVALTSSFLHYGGLTYRPLFWLSLFIDRTLWGLNAGGFHATNVALHLLNGNLIFTLLRRLKMEVFSAAAVSLLWLSLPVDTEVVAWISGRAYALCTLFILLCLLAALNYLHRGGFIWGLVCFVTGAGAVLSHELGVMTLPLLLLVALGTKHKWNRRLLITVGFICLAILGAELLRFGIGVKAFSGLASIKWASLALWQYVVLTLFPLHMSVERSTSISLSQAHPWLLFSMACIALALSYAVFRRQRNPAVLGGFLWFALCIAPFCFFTNYQGVAERFAYLAAIGIATAIVAACFIGSEPRVRNLLTVCVTIWFVWNIYKTSVRVNDWSDPVRLFQHSLEATPLSPSLHYNLAFSFRQRGDLQNALNEYQRVLNIDKDYPNTFASLGDVYLQMGSFSAALTAYKQALSRNPNDTAVLLNSAMAYQGVEAMNEAEAAYQRVLQINPTNTAAHVDLGVFYMKEKKPENAARQFAIAINEKSSDPAPYFDLAVLMQQAGRGDLALALYKKVLELKPNDEDTLHNIEILSQTH
jgi:protein O-mannosyl-transferase